MKKILGLTATTLVFAGAIGFLRTRPADQEIQGYTATFVTEMSTRTGKIDQVEGEVIAVRSNGDVSFQKIEEGHARPNSVKTATRTYEFDPQTHLISTIPFKTPIAKVVMSSPDPSCETHSEIKDDLTKIGHGTFYGLPVVKWRQKMKESEAAGGGTLVLERWETPTLGCMAIYSEGVLYDSEDNFQSSNHKMLVDLKSGEPNPALFDPPADAQEVLPSQLFTSWAIARGLRVTGTQADANRMDQKFLALKAAQAK